MKNLILTLAAVCTLVPAVAFAQTAEEAEFFRIRLDTLLDDFDDDRKVDLFAFKDVDGDGHTDLVLASYDLKRTTVYSSADEETSRRPMTLTPEMTEMLRNRDEMYYADIVFLMESIDRDPDDHLNRLAPLFIWDADPDANTFSFATSDEDVISASAGFKAYTKLVFKPHVGDVTFVGPDNSEKEYYDFNLVWKLDDPAFAKTEFRGYKNHEAAPILFKDGFQNTINLLNFSRWKSPEPVKAVSQDVKDLISGYYRGEQILGIRYVADCSANERSWYRVMFARRGDTSHYALVCLAEGSVASVWDTYMDLSDFGASPSDVWYGGSLKEFWDYKEVEFMAMWGSPSGLEIAVRWSSMEGIHYSILREYGSKMVLARDGYQYLMAY